MKEKLLTALEEVRKTLRLHKGGIDLVSLDEATGEVVLQFTGMCAHCGLSSITLKKGVEVVLCERVPEITKIRLVDAHV
jgi:Fe-S cluster biogenesis protein NfuA